MANKVFLVTVRDNDGKTYRTICYNQSELSLLISNLDSDNYALVSVKAKMFTHNFDYWLFNYGGDCRRGFLFKRNAE